MYLNINTTLLLQVQGIDKIQALEQMSVNYEVDKM